jgi:putative nucleotidyltransferase with HDIG domain
VFLLVAVTGFVFYAASNQRGLLNFFYLPVLVGAYFFGKRHAAFSAFLSVLLIVIVAMVYPETFLTTSNEEMQKWLDVITWGSFLVITGYCTGALYEKKERANEEIRRTYQGVIEMLSLIIDSVDQETQNHSYRVSVIAENLAGAMGCPRSDVENIRAAALLHDLGKLGVNNAVLQKMGALTLDERKHMETHTDRGVELIEPVGGKVLQILPFILYHHEQYDGKGYHKLIGDDIPLGARIIAVADVYDALISDRPYRKGISRFEARDHIMKNSGVLFDPAVAAAFEELFPKLDLMFAVSPVRPGLHSHIGI